MSRKKTEIPGELRCEECPDLIDRRLYYNNPNKARTHVITNVSSSIICSSVLTCLEIASVTSISPGEKILRENRGSIESARTKCAVFRPLAFVFGQEPSPVG